MKAMSPFRRSTRQLGRVGAVVAAGSIVVMSSGVSYAYFVGATGSGTGTATTGSPLTITASGATLSGTLYPGATANLVVTLANPYANSALTITGVAAGTGSVQVSGGTNCTSANADVSVNTSASSFSPSTVAAGATTQITVNAAVKMGPNSATGCQGASFAVPVAVTVKVG